MDYAALDMGVGPDKMSKKTISLVDLDVHVFGLDEIKGSTLPIGVVVSGPADTRLVNGARCLRSPVASCRVFLTLTAVPLCCKLHHHSKPSSTSTSSSSSTTDRLPRTMQRRQKHGAVLARHHRRDRQAGGQGRAQESARRARRHHGESPVHVESGGWVWRRYQYPTCHQLLLINCTGLTLPGSPQPRHAPQAPQDQPRVRQEPAPLCRHGRNRV